MRPTGETSDAVPARSPDDVAKSATIVADEAEALAFADLYAAAGTELTSRLGLRVERVADALLLLAPGRLQGLVAALESVCFTGRSVTLAGLRRLRATGCLGPPC